MESGSIFVISAPLAGASRLAAWLGRRTRIRSQWLIDRSGPDWNRHSDRFLPGSETWMQARERLGLRALPRIEAHPALALNVDVLASTFPKARFVFLYRDVRENLARMLHAWDRGSRAHESGMTIAGGRRWCLSLPPGWSTVAHRSLEEIVAWQWASTVRTALQALDALPPDRWVVASFDRLLRDSESEFQRLRQCLFLPARPMRTAFANTLEQSPDPEIWRPYAERLTPVLSQVATEADRAVRLFAASPATRIRTL